MAPCKDARRAGQGTRSRLEELNSLQDRRTKAAKRARKYRERKRALLQNTLQNIEQAIVGTTSTSVNIERAANRAANEWAFRWFEETSHRGLEFQKALLPKILKHSVWQPVLPSYAEMEVAHNAIGNLSRGWQQVKGCHSTNHQRARNVIIPMVLGSNTVSARQASLVTGINRRNMRSGLVRRIALEARTDQALWAICGRSKRVDALAPHVTKLVADYWTANTRISPNRKDVVSKRIGAKQWIDHPTHHLQESQLSLYTRFKSEHPAVEIGVRSFETLKPWFVKRLKEFNTCCCRDHVQTSEHKDGLNSMRRGSVHKNCNCPCKLCRLVPGVTECMAAHATFSGVTALCESVLCPKQDMGEFHKLDCIQGLCELCGVSTLQICPQELSTSPDTLVSWRGFEMVFVGRGDDGRDRHALRLEHKMTPPADLVIALKTGLKKFLTHNFEAKWQDQQFKKCMENLSPDAIVSVIDFAENYSFKWQNEVQSQHWFSFQVTILVHITFRIHPDWNGMDPQTRLLTEYHFYISDDKSHDNQFVQHCFSMHQDFLIQQGFPLPVEHIVFSDGCAAQFKCAKNLYFVARYPSLTRTDDLPLGCMMQWNWFGSGHGKGRWDGAGAHVKQALRAEQVKPQGLKLHCANDVVQFLRMQMTREYAGYSGARRSVNRYFYNVTEVAVNVMPSLNARTVDGTRSFHQVRSVNLEGTSLQVRDLSCFCRFCMDGGDGPCNNASYVSTFVLIRLEPCKTAIDSRREKGRYKTDEQRLHPRIHPRMTAGEARAATLEFRDHFAVLADEGGNGPEFWILQCTGTLHAVEEVTKEDSWGQTVYQGEQIVTGTYYKQKGKNVTSFIREDPNRPALIYSHLVLASKFQMPVATHRQKGGPRGTQVYALQQEDFEMIQSRLLEID